MSTRTQAGWLDGLRAALPLTMGVLPFAIAFGLSAREAELTTWQVGAMSVVVFAGSAQFLAVAMLKAGASIPQVWLATLALNSRHLLMALVLVPRFSDSPLWRRALGAHVISDESFAVTSRREDSGPWFLIGAGGAIGVAWIGGGLAGAALAADLPSSLAEAASFSLVAFFVALVATTARGLPAWLTAVAAGLLALGLIGLVPRGWDLLIAGAGAAALGALTERPASHENPA